MSLKRARALLERSDGGAPDDGARKASAAVARFEGLTAPRALPLAQVVRANVQHDAPAEKIGHEETRGHEDREHLPASVCANVPEVSWMPVRALQSAVGGAPGAEMRTCRPASVAGEVSKLMHVQAVQAGRYAAQANVHSRAPSVELGESHSARNRTRHRVRGQEAGYGLRRRSECLTHRRRAGAKLLLLSMNTRTASGCFSRTRSWKIFSA